MNSKVLWIGSWKVSPSELQITQTLANGDKVQEALPPKVFEVLMALVEAPNQTVTNEELIERVWQGNAAVGKRGITNAIYHLRKVLSASDTETIRTISKTGYQLLLPVNEKRLAKFTPLQISAAVATLVILPILTFVLSTKPAPIPPSINYGPAIPITYLEGVEETPALSKDGQYLAFMWEQPDNIGQLFVKDLTDDTAPLRQLSFSNQTESNPSWSPDGNRLAFTRINGSGHCEVWIKSLADLSEERITTCMQERFHRVLDWSPSGRYLAVIDKVPHQTHSAIFLFDLITLERRQLSRPKGGERDSQLAWAHQSDTLAFIRSQGDYASELFQIDLNQNERQLTQDNALIHGLTWSISDDHIVFNSMRQGAHALWQLNLSGGQLTPLYRDQTPFNIIALENEAHYAYVRHASLEYLELNNQGQQHKLESSGRDLYGSLSPIGDKVAFLSNRSGQFEIWLANIDGSAPLQLTHREGKVGIPTWSPDGKQLATFINHQDLAHLLFISPANNKRQLLTLDGAGYRNPKWSRDGTSLLFSSNRGGTWQIWALQTATGKMKQLTLNGGRFAELDIDGSLYFTRTDRSGLWRIDPQQRVQQLFEDLAFDDWGNWLLTDAGILYLSREEHLDKLMLWSNGERLEIDAYPRGTIKINRSLSRDRLGNFLLTRVGKREANIVKIAPQRMEGRSTAIH